MSNINDLVTKLQRLNLEQQHLVENIIDELNSSHNIDQQDRNNTATATQKHRESNNEFISSNRNTLAIGDTVKILNTRKTAKQGDIAKILKFNKKYVAVQLKRNKSHTQRLAKYLELVDYE